MSLATRFELDIQAFLEPITPENPVGLYLRYNDSTDKKIRASVKLYYDLEEARREEEDAISEGDDDVGNWSRDRKKADWPRTVELATILLQEHTKDLQVVAWLVEALARMHGVAGIHQGLLLMRSITDRFWEDLHPQGDDPEDRIDVRSGVYEWLDSSKILPFLILKEPLVSIPHESGIRYAWLDEKRILDFEESYRKPPKKKKTSDPDPPTAEEILARWEAEGGIRIGAFQNYVKATSLAFYEGLIVRLNDCHETVETFNEDLRSSERFGASAVVLTHTLESLETCQKRVERLLRDKRAAQSSPEVQSEADEPETADEERATEASSWDDWNSTVAEPETEAEPESGPEPVPAEDEVAPTPTPRRPPQHRGGPITDVDEAASRVAEAAAFFRQADSGDPVPYLILAALRMGESYRSGGWTDGGTAPAPPTEARQTLRKLAQEGDWTKILTEAEHSLSRPDGQGWLDAHRLAIQALAQQGHEPASRAAKAFIGGWLNDQPEWTGRELDDGTPAANSDSRTWAAELVRPAIPPEPIAPPSPPPLPEPPMVAERDREINTPEKPVDPWDQARELVAQGRVADAIRLLDQAARSATAGRERFLRRLQQAQVCVNSRRTDLALSLFEELARLIDTHHLEDWEESSLCAQVFAGLYRCLKATQPDRAAAIYSRLCLLDLSLALTCSAE